MNRLNTTKMIVLRRRDVEMQIHKLVKGKIYLQTSEAYRRHEMKNRKQTKNHTRIDLLVYVK